MGDLQESSTNWQRLRFPRAAVPRDVGERVADARKARRWSQARLAVRAGLSRASVYRLEGGGVPSRADTLFRIAHALDMPIRDLVPDWPEWEPIKGHGPGEAARERRRALGLSLAELAQEIGVSEASLSRYERSIGVSPAFVRRVGDDVVPSNELLERLLGLEGGE